MLRMTNKPLKHVLYHLFSWVKLELVSLCCFQRIHHSVPGFDWEVVIVPRRIYSKHWMMRLCALVCLLTVEICQFFDIFSQVSCHSQGLSHLQVGLSEEERREKVKKTHE